MLRSILIYLSTAAWARRIVTRWDFAWRAASRFISGETIDDAIRAIRELNQRGINATLDHLGEHTTNEQEALQSTEDILKAIDAIDAANVRANVSIKLTQIGLALGGAICAENLRRILSYALERGNFVRIDMEDSGYVDQTLELFNQMRIEGFNNTGVVIQAYLFRSAEDARRIVDAGGRIRLCKGAYKEPPEVAFPKKGDVDANYDRLAKLLIDAAIGQQVELNSSDGKFPPIPAIASHDPHRLAYAKSYAADRGLPPSGIEFQMSR